MRMKIFKKYYSGILKKRIDPIIREWMIENKGIDIYLTGELTWDFLNISIHCGTSRFRSRLEICLSDPNAIDSLAYSLKTNLQSPKINITHLERGHLSALIIGEVLKGSHHINIEITCLKKDNLEPTNSLIEDAERRAFFCKAIYLKVNHGRSGYKLVDPTGHGLNDLKHRVIRTINDPKLVFKRDPYKMLEAIMLQSDLSIKGKPAEYDVKLNAAIEYTPDYEKIPLDKLREFLSHILLSEYNPSVYFKLLHERNLLKRILPTLDEAWGFNQNSIYHSLNLTEHILLVLDICSSSLMLPIEEKQLELMLAALLHDISKYTYHELKKDGHFSFPGHEIESAKLADYLLSRLGYNSSIISYVHNLIENHMILKQLWDKNNKHYKANNKTTVKIYKKLLKLGILDSELILINADNNAHAVEWNMPNQVEEFKTSAFDLITRPIKLPAKKIPTAIPNGNKIKEIFNLNKPGIVIGEILEIMELLYWNQPDRTNLAENNLIDIYNLQFDEGLIVAYRAPDENTKEEDITVGAAIVSNEQLQALMNNDSIFSKVGFELTTLDKELRNRIFNDRLGVLGTVTPVYAIRTGFDFFEKVVFLSSRYYPKLDLELKTKEKVRDTLNKVRELYSELADVPDVKEVEMHLNYGDEITGIALLKRGKPLVIQ